MQRLLTISSILGLALICDRLMNTKDIHLMINHLDIINDFKFVIIGVVLGGVYIFRFGTQYAEDRVYDKSHSLSSFSLITLLPGREFLIKLSLRLLSPLKYTWIGQYFLSLYCPPVASERVLGGFFFGKTMVTTAIAFYEVSSTTLLMILVFSAIFDSLTGTYQHTLMNYFHRSMFKNKIARFMHNLSKRFAVDIIRAEIIMLILLGSELLQSANQFHIFKNRLVSATYYFNAVIIDKLVDMGAISRNFRSNFVIIASTLGGMLCLLDFAKTKFPTWVPADIIQSIPSNIPGPLVLLMYFNISVFIIMGSLYLINFNRQKLQKIAEGKDHSISQKIQVMLYRIITIITKY